MLSVKEQTIPAIMTMQEQHYAILMKIHMDLGSVMAKVENLEKEITKITDSMKENDREHYLINSVSGWIKPSLLVFMAFGLKWIGATIWNLVANKP